MSTEDSLSILDMEYSSFPIKELSNSSTSSHEVVNRRRSNSQSQVVSMPSNSAPRKNQTLQKRQKFQYIITLTPLNDTFVRKSLTVPYFPATRKLGRPAGAKIKPDYSNGYFDSRVLSRNHAAMFVDPSNGKLMLKDLGSSNGTYVNEERIGSEPVEIKIGDIIFLGFNIQVDTNHKQISAKVENINIVSNLLKSSNDFSSARNQDSPECKYANFIQELHNRVSSGTSLIQKEDSEVQRSFESAFFADINPELEDNLLGLSDSNLIFAKLQSPKTLPLEKIITTLGLNLSKLKQQTKVLNTIENFLTNYQHKLSEINAIYLEKELHKRISKYELEISEEKATSQKIKEDFEQYKIESRSEIDDLSKVIEILEKEKGLLHKKVNSLHGSENVKKEFINATNETNVNKKNTPSARNITSTDEYEEIKESDVKKESIDLIDGSLHNTMELDSKEKYSDYDHSNLSRINPNRLSNKDPITFTLAPSTSESEDKSSNNDNNNFNSSPFHEKNDPNDNEIKTAFSSDERVGKKYSVKSHGIYIGLLILTLGIILEKLVS